MRSRFFGASTALHYHVLVHDKRAVRAARVNAFDTSEINSTRERNTSGGHKRCSLARVVKISLHKAPCHAREIISRALKCHRSIVYQKSSPEIIILHRIIHDRHNPRLFTSCKRLVRAADTRRNVKPTYAPDARYGRRADCTISHYPVRIVSVYQPFFIALDT